jgi:hypothetical protein
MHGSSLHMLEQQRIKVTAVSPILKRQFCSARFSFQIPPHGPDYSSDVSADVGLEEPAKLIRNI